MPPIFEHPAAWPVFIAVGAVFVAVVMYRARKDASNQEAKSHYSDAERAFRAADWNLALYYLGKSLDAAETPGSYTLLGMTWANLSRYDLAAKAYQAARLRLQHSYDSDRPLPDDPGKTVTALYHAQALALARSDHRVAAYEIANEALELMESGFIPPMGRSGTDCEVRLRTIRAVAALSHYEVEETLSVALADADWVCHHGFDTEREDILKPLLSLRDKTQLAAVREEVSTLWERLDRYARRTESEIL